jgi:hypothetical protein
MPLKDMEIRTLKAGDRIYKRTDERGLYLEVRPNGSKLWRFKYSYNGKDKWIAFGSYPEVGLADARRMRDAARRKVQAGTDPVTERRQEKLVACYAGATTFGAVAKEYIDKMVAEGRADTTTTKANWLLEQLAPLAPMPISERPRLPSFPTPRKPVTSSPITGSIPATSRSVRAGIAARKAPAATMCR